MYNVYWLAGWLLLWGLKYLEYNSCIRTENTLNKRIIKHWIIKQSESNKSKTEMNKSRTTDNNNRKLAMNMNKHLTYNRRLSRYRSIFASVKYLCDYKTDNCNSVCPSVSYEASDVMLSVSFSFTAGSLVTSSKTIEPLSSFVASYLTLQCSTSQFP